MTQKDTWVRPAPPVHKWHVQRRCTSQRGAEEEELCCILPTHTSLCHTGFTIQEDEID